MMQYQKAPRKIAIFTDIHGLLEPLEAILIDIKKRGITEIYSLGDNIGIGPSPFEVITAILENNVHSVLGNYEETLLHGYGMYSSYLTKEKIEDSIFTKTQLTQEQIAKISKWPHSIEIHTNHHHLALCHFANDVRWDFLFHNSYMYMKKIQSGQNGYPQFSYTNSKSQMLYLAHRLGMKLDDLVSCSTAMECLTRIQNDIKRKKRLLRKEPSLSGYLSSIEDPLFFHQNELKTVYDYDCIIQGHTHFEVLEENQNTKFYALRGASLGFSDYDSVEFAKYLIINIVDDHIYFKTVEVPYDREKMIFKINHAEYKNQLIRKYTCIK